MAKSPYADTEDVRYAYRLLLGRTPDQQGFDHYARLVGAGTLTPSEIANAILGSEEFTSRRNDQERPIEVALNGYSMFVRSIDRDIGAWILRNKMHEPHVTQVVRNLLRPGDTFVDVGANIGYFTALAAYLVGPDGKVVAVEPMDKNLQLLYATIFSNKFAHVEIHPFAASDVNGLLPMETGFGTSNGQVILTGARGRLPAMFAQARRLDDMLSGLSTIRLLKIDIEGYELIALSGFAAGLARHRPLLLTEFHPKCMRENSMIEPEAYLSMLFAYGDEVQVLHENGEQIACRDAESVMREWRRAGMRMGGDGTNHLDLLVRPR
ncbi:hypothetical protein GCM10009105_19310 [Dokdonella soli]|uniref:FkbM family methyltransferase n=2 Tax=Dokdonella soli TaxID=529810 RepID=A0ABP3TT76_9GAMM